MTHLNEEQLVFYHYGEGEERAGVEAHLAACSACQARYQTLQQVLTTVDAEPVPEQGEGYGAQVWAQLEPKLAEAKRPRWFEWLEPRRLAWAGAVATLVLAAFLAGRYWPGPPVAGPTSPQVRERILLVAVGDHLERSEMVLIELVNTQSNGTADISHEQAWAQELVADNRLYRQTASQAGEAGVASVLDELERTLLEIANSSSELSGAELKDLQERIEAKGILFKVRVISSQMRAREKTVAQEGVSGRA